MFNGFGGWHALVLLVIVVLIFGAAKLPGLAKSVGQSMKIFKNEVRAPDELRPDSTAQANFASTGTPAGPTLNESSPEVRAQTETKY